MLSKLTHLTFLLLLITGVVFFKPNLTHAATFEDQVESLINSERQKQSLSPLTHSDKLFQAALDHNTKMSNCANTYGVNPCFAHTVTQLSEKSLLDRIKDTGYNPQSVAENIAWGYTTPASVVAGWMGSSGHRANILGNYKDIGCDYLDSLSGSYKGMYWTCDFGKSFNTTSSATPTPTPTIRPTATPTPTKIPTPTPTSVMPTPTPTSIETQGSVFDPTSDGKPWICKFMPTASVCK